MIHGEDDWVAQTLARRYFWPGSDLDDRIQEARVAMLEARRNFKPGTGRWTVYAWRAVKYHLLDCIRSAERRPVLVSPEPLEHMAHPHSWDTTDALLDIRRAWPSLSPTQADHLAQFVGGSRYREIEGCGGGEAIHIARRKLREAA